MDKQREMFEDWFVKDTGYVGYDLLQKQGGVYFQDETELAWQSWQAAQKAQWQLIETAPKDGTSFVGYMNYDDYIHAEMMHIEEDGFVYATNDNDEVAYTPWKHVSLWTALPQEQSKPYVTPLLGLGSRLGIEYGDGLEYQKSVRDTE